MLVLALDTATPAVTAGVVTLDDEGPRLLAERVTVDAKAHGELLTPHLRDALAEAGAGMGDVDAIVCGVGPGPFTGLRAGMVTAAALADALEVPAYPVCSLDAIAADVPGEAPLLVVTDARRREVYWASYLAGNRVEGPRVQRPAELLAELGSVTRVAGGGVSLCEFPAAVEVVGTAQPSPVGLVRAAGSPVLEGAAPAPLTPLYLRRPDAVEPGARKRVSQA
ncbi:tRNA threonylcarbamoyl adenosine modification protein YeaZ [Tamaricihabitans halophyticus]|uniref:tRNA threonylcarbamoyl adenosine modification protein YeaZ n=1 Tax=Tamaricihabitans halophyticus TaxID=1262583 RepID=A0A4R2R1D7_9PSEU|nr:tRNA (adenosine(37)-N6)-threonylcarbamoyltransferase complex dimerization subunit type 1 TsaB [Tamaricihabitans halophyticus]TCP53261.1 tRNA threonylcarbamoyl adenosine modification protein YeaZ [Tamaricihabitans halophyticus]